jgi:GTP-binding protein LepA
VYPLETTDYDKLKDSFGKLQLNDAALEFELENSSALGFGLRCGFLGMLHMDIVKERLTREYDLETIFTTPSVMYLMRSKNFSLDVIKSGTNVTHLFES